MDFNADTEQKKFINIYIYFHQGDITSYVLIDVTTYIIYQYTGINKHITNNNKIKSCDNNTIHMLKCYSFSDTVPDSKLVRRESLEIKRGGVRVVNKSTSCALVAL